MAAQASPPATPLTTPLRLSLEKTLPGFGEIFRQLSYAQIGSRAIASRAIAGIHGKCLIFSMPGSPAAVQLAMRSLILPELPHLVKQLHQGKH